jgi:hypothetical protein
MAEQESQRQTFTNIIVTLSVVAFTFGFDTTQVSKAVQVALLLVISVANLVAISYMQRTRYWLRTHRSRAKKVLKTYAPDLYLIDKVVIDEIDQKYLEKEYKLFQNMYKYFGGRGRIQAWLHVALFVVSIVLFILALVL